MMKGRLLLIAGWGMGLALLTLTPLSGPPAHAQALPCDRYVLAYDGYDVGVDERGGMIYLPLLLRGS